MNRISRQQFLCCGSRVRQVAEGIESLGLRWWARGVSIQCWRGQTALGKPWLEVVWRWFYGAESADQETLDAMNKGGLEVRQTLELNHRAASYGVIPEFSFVMGNPTDPEGDIDRTLAMARRLKQENEDCEIILYLYSPVPMPDADGQVPVRRALNFQGRWMNG